MPWLTGAASASWVLETTDCERVRTPPGPLSSSAVSVAQLVFRNQYGATRLAELAFWLSDTMEAFHRLEGGFPCH
jgi:hypothetical protein